MTTTLIGFTHQPLTENFDPRAIWTKTIEYLNHKQNYLQNDYATHENLDMGRRNSLHVYYSMHITDRCVVI